ncbi:hypothetical protein OAI97_02905 [Nitrosopumilus sp.]|nr:hypothetical protein [Nitrosopumilus sp.]
MNKFWFFLGIFLVFTGFGTMLGIMLIVFFIWDDLKSDIKTQNNSEDDVEFTAKYYNEDTLNDMK